MYKARNARTRNRMRWTQGIGGCYVPGNVAKQSGECRQTFQGMSLTIARNFVKYFGECPQIFRGISTSIPENVVKHVSSNIPANVSKRSGECRQTFQGMSSNIPGNVLKHSGECLCYSRKWRTQGQSRISSCCFCVWSKSRELGSRESLRFSCVTQMVESFSQDLLQAVTGYWAEWHLVPVIHPRWSSSAKIANGFISTKEHLHKCSTGFQMLLRFKVL